ncbi:MAG: SGNH/GDSL hydrolase family protein [Planctomycetaceae bacterium]|nr:SGNH/GDSL hydrolase family protein [Planctomycetaceae bacterium]
MNSLKFGAMLLALCFLSASISQAAEKSRLVENLHSGKQQTVVTYGTSLTAGGAWVRQLGQELERAYPGKANVINSGSGGMWSTWGVDNLDKRVIQKKPDTVLIEFAINDAFLNYKTSVDLAQSNLENMIDRILKSNPDCEIVLMVMNPPIGVHLTRRPKIKEYYQMYREVAQARKLLLIDHYPKWETILKDNPDLFNKYVPDGIHPNPQGCKAVITPQIVKSLGIAGE